MQKNIKLVTKFLVRSLLTILPIGYRIIKYNHFCNTFLEFSGKYIFKTLYHHEKRCKSTLRFLLYILHT